MKMSNSEFIERVLIVLLILGLIIRMSSCMVNVVNSKINYNFCVEQGYTGSVEINKIVYCYQNNNMKIINIEELRKK